MSIQQDLNAAYNAEVNRIAEVLAKIEYDASKFRMLSWQELTKGANGQLEDFVGQEHYQMERDALISMKLEQARAMAAEMATVAKDFHHAGWTNRGSYDHQAPGAKVGQLEYLLVQRGLIPNTKTDSNG